MRSREKVGKKLPEILDLSKRNFQVFETFAKQP